MTVFDYTFLSILGLSALLGLWRGLVSEIMAVASWVLALLAAWRYADVAAELLNGVIGNSSWRMVAAFALIVIAVLLLASLLRYLLRSLLRAAGLGATDRFFGTLFGIVRGLAIALLAVSGGGMIDNMPREPWWEQALFAPPLETAVIAAKPWMPDAVAEKIHFR